MTAKNLKNPFLSLFVTYSISYSSILKLQYCNNIYIFHFWQVEGRDRTVKRTLQIWPQKLKGKCTEKYEFCLENKANIIIFPLKIVQKIIRKPKHRK